MDDEIVRAARRAGLRDVVRPTLEHVERRRVELIAVTLVVLLGFSLGMVVLSFTNLSFLQGLGGSLSIVRFGLILLAVVFGAYVFEKEQRLRTVTRSLVNERVYSAALVNRLREISLLNRAGRAVTSSLDLEEVLDVVLHSASELLEADEGSVMLLHGDILLVAAASGRGSSFVGERKHITDGVAGYVARSRQALLIQDEVEMTELSQLIGSPLDRGDGTRSSLSVPLEADGNLLGVLNLNVSTGDRRYEEYDLRLLQLFAQHAAVAIHAARVLGAEPTVSRSEVAQLERLRADVAHQVTRSYRDPTDRAEPGHRAEAKRGAGKRALIVEDDPVLLNHLRTSFEVAGYDVDLASDGETALRRLDTDTHDILLLEMAVPARDGWNILQRLRDRPRRPHIICMSDRTTRRDAIRAWTLGADEYMTKPFDMADLVDLATDVLTRSSDTQDERRRSALRELFAAS